jgi:hypothetical protein
LLVIGGTVLALGAGVLGVGAQSPSASTFFMARPSFHDALPLGRPDYPSDAEYRLLDQRNGQIKALPFPAQEDWSLISVSPWRDKDGNLEAAGRWVCRGNGPQEFCGIGRLTLADSTVKKRVTLDALPIGRPCWVYGRPGEILFPAGDGQLYRCKIGGETGEDAADNSQGRPPINEGTVGKARAVTWATATPDLAAAYLNDPSGLSEPRLSHLLFVSLSLKETRGGRQVMQPSKLWWLALNDEGDAIVNAGRLTEPRPEEPRNDTVVERLPSVVTRAGGDINLVYLTKNLSQKLWQLHSAKLEIDAESARPRMRSRTGSKLLATGVAASSLVVSADGEYVFAIDGCGQIIKHSIPR